MLQRVFFGPLNEKYKGYTDLNGRELLSLVPLAAVVVLFGVYPQPLIDMTKTSVENTRTHVLAANEAARGSGMGGMGGVIVTRDADADATTALLLKHASPEGDFGPLPATPQERFVQRLLAPSTRLYPTTPKTTRVGRLPAEP
jgi:hypothetical protein